MKTTNTNTETAAKTKISYPFRTKAQILEQIANDPGYVEDCLVYLYNQQTAEELATNVAKGQDGRGFNSGHRGLGSRLAAKLRENGAWDSVELEQAQKLVSRYRKQLAARERAEVMAKDPEAAKIAAVFGLSVNS